jgi:hypothetical protein
VSDGGVKTDAHCDFCNDPAIRWRFHARRSQTVSPDSIGSHGVRLHYLDRSDHPQDTDWAACDECKALIVGGRRDALVERALTSPHSDWVVLLQTMSLSRDERRKLRRTIRNLHDTFWKNREGPPQEVTR